MCVCMWHALLSIFLLLMCACAAVNQLLEDSKRFQTLSSWLLCVYVHVCKCVCKCVCACACACVCKRA